MSILYLCLYLFLFDAALSLFLNAEHGLCRALLVQILSGLWRIQKWARSQRTLRLYSSSVLIAYDARLLRNQLDVQRKANATAASTSPFDCHPQNPQKTNGASPGHSPKPKDGKLRRSFGTMSRSTSSKSNNSTSSPIAVVDRSSPFDWSPKPINGSGSPTTALAAAASLSSNNSSSSQEQTPTTPVEMYRKVQRNHSMRNNYDEDLKAIRENYALMLDNLIGGFKSDDWVHVKMIDFAHVFEAERRTADAEVDANYLFGVESAVRLFEEFLRDC